MIGNGTSSRAAGRAGAAERARAPAHARARESAAAGAVPPLESRRLVAAALLGRAVDSRPERGALVASNVGASGGALQAPVAVVDVQAPDVAHVGAGESRELDVSRVRVVQLGGSEVRTGQRAAAAEFDVVDTAVLRPRGGAVGLRWWAQAGDEVGVAQDLAVGVVVKLPPRRARRGLTGRRRAAERLARCSAASVATATRARRCGTAGGPPPLRLAAPAGARAPGARSARGRSTR